MSLKMLEREKTSEKNSVSFRTGLIIFLVTVIVILSLILGIIILNHNVNKYKKEAEKAKAEVQEMLDEAVLLEKVSKTISTDEIESSMEKIGELATIEYIYTDAGKFEDSNKFKDFKIPFTRKSFIVKWSGTIKAGISLEDVKTEIDEDNKTITVYVPESEILSHTHDPDGFEILDESNNIFNPIEVDDVNTFTVENDSFTEQRAIEKGLLEKADENARTIIENSLMSNPIISQNYKIEFAVPDETETAETTTATTIITTD